MPSGKYIRKYWKGFLLAFVFLMLEAAADLMMPTLLARIIDRGIASGDMHYVLRIGGFMLLITAGGAVAASLRNVLAVHVSQKFGTELRSDLFRKIQTLGFAQLDRFERASLITRMTNDITLVQHFVSGMMRIFVKAPLLGIGALILAVRLNPELSAVFAVVVPIVAVLVAFSMKVGFARFLKVQQSLDRVNASVREYLSGVRVVKAFNRFDYEREKFARTNEEQRAASTHAMRAMAVFNPAIMLTVNLGVVAILWIGGVWIETGVMAGNRVGELVAFINYMTQILFALMMVSMVFAMFVRARASAIRIGEVFRQEEAEAPPAGPDAAAVVTKGRIDFENVSFAYANAPGAPALRNVTFSCLPGETVGIIGSTGSGKSSLVHLVPRFYDASGGRVLVDGIDVRSMDPARLRDMIAIVPQKSVLFTGTIRENIRWGDETASDEEVERAARTAEAHEFIERLPEGYESRLGQRGVNLSGGQKQRLAIARALVRRPRILILDDSTSAVDTATESRIKAALRTYVKGLTCLVIAQRITSVMDLDKIVVMDLGEVVGVGTHEELMRENRVYREIYASQIGKELQPHVGNP
ncbi:ABC transporter ATP-binding protein [Paenibacillus sp.]|uniref:ABC transporter ATP-binding protein n=1 Tax=Paenibacillus sp. TaxID=58172 RepID=UPI002D2D2E87|nr:ABC transporter ATP-binding protein [Paenibacillus sp.]HZG58258.1 ABC transporter ATP-binding protein [Paenibacillus sp.]